jgi:Tfp pilus assembly protein PilO
MALNKRERTLLVATITILAVGGNWFLIAPLAKNWGALQRNLTIQRQQLAAFRATIEREPEWKVEANKLRAGLGERAGRIEQASDVVKKIEEAGASSGVQITARRQMPTVERDVYRELPVQCSIDAKIDSLVKFLYALQTGSGLMSVEQITVSQNSANPSILRCDIQIRALSGKSGGDGT